MIILPGSLARLGLAAGQWGRLRRLAARPSLQKFGSYAIYRRELRYWEARLGGQARLGEVFGLLTLGSLVFLPAALVMFPAVLLAYAALDEALWLGAALTASGLVVREREAFTWSLIRVTPVTGLQIVAGKLTGLLSEVWEGVAYLVGARWLGTLLVVPLLALMLALPHPYPFSLAWPVALLGLVAAYALFVYRPSVNAASGGALGLALSTFPRSTSGALLLAMLVAGGLSLSFGGLVWWWLRAFDAGQLFSESILAGRLQAIFYFLLPLGAVTLARLLAAPLLFGLAAWRVGHMPE